MIKFLIDHPALFLFLLPAIPAVLGKLEKVAIASLLSRGDTADQKLMRAVAVAVVTWAEDKIGASNGAAKFDVADKLLARALPFLSADQRQHLIESCVSELDKDAHEAIDSAAAAKK